MPSSASSSASSSPSASSSASEFPRKRKRGDPSDQELSSDGSGTSDAESESDSESEELVLSHAAKRKQKKESQKKVADLSKEAKKGATGVKAKDSGPPKRQNSIWVGNLAFKTTPDALRQFFESVGEITRIHIPTKPGPPQGAGPTRRENRGFAYVDFVSPDAKVVAITMSERNLDGRRLLIKDGDDFTGRPAAPAAAPGDVDMSKPGATGTGMSKTAQKILSNQKQPPAQTLFLGNLGFETTEQSIQQLFEAHRTVKPEEEAPNEENEKKDVWIRKVRLGTFEDSGVCKGFAFVDFTKTEHATAALVNPKNHQLNGRKLVVEYASAEAVRRGGGPRPKREFRHEQSEGGGPRKMRKLRIAEKKRNEPAESTAMSANETSPHGEPPVSKLKFGMGGDRRERSNKRRAAPGAALALAKREQVSIVPSEGKRIVFDA